MQGLSPLTAAASPKGAFAPPAAATTASIAGAGTGWWRRLLGWPWPHRRAVAVAAPLSPPAGSGGGTAGPPAATTTPQPSKGARLWPTLLAVAVIVLLVGMMTVLRTTSGPADKEPTSDGNGGPATPGGADGVGNGDSTPLPNGGASAAVVNYFSFQAAGDLNIAGGNFGGTTAAPATTPTPASGAGKMTEPGQTGSGGNPATPGTGPTGGDAGGGGPTPLPTPPTTTPPSLPGTPMGGWGESSFVGGHQLYVQERRLPNGEMKFSGEFRDEESRTLLVVEIRPIRGGSGNPQGNLRGCGTIIWPAEWTRLVNVYIRLTA